MINLKPIGANQTQITKDDGTLVLYSYETPVAIYIPGRGYVRTLRYYSRTTSKHINAWIGEYPCEMLGQYEFEKLV